MSGEKLPKTKVVKKPSRGLKTYVHVEQDVPSVPAVELRMFLRDGSSFVVPSDGGLPGAREAAEEVFRKGYVEVAHQMASGDRVEFYPVAAISFLRAASVRQPT